MLCVATAFPIFCQFLLMQSGPLKHEGLHSIRGASLHNVYGIDPDDDLLPAIQSVKMRRRVIIIVHTD